MAQFNRLFVAEKQSVADGLAEHLARTTGARAVKRGGHIEVGADRIVAMAGHLLEQAEPAQYDAKYKDWNLADLPIIPDSFKLVIKPRTKDKVSLIRELLADCTTVVGYGDPDAEGQLLQDELLLYLRNRKPVIRLWVNALNDAALSKALADMKPNDEYRGWYESALSRSQADWLYGMNLSRACSLHARAAGGRFKFAIGRVQTPTLGLVVRREHEIRNFKPTNFFVPTINLASSPAFSANWFAPKEKNGTYADQRVDLEGRLLDKAKADAITAAVQLAGQAVVKVADAKPGTESAPLPFSLASLQAHCSKLFGMSASDTLAVAQALYLAKLTTYPRVDTCYLPEEQHSEAPGILASLQACPLPPALLKAIAGADASLKSKAWDTEKTTAHFAIIPALLDKQADVSSLKPTELKVYLEVVKRYVLQFWPVARFTATELVLDAAGEMFAARGRAFTFEGWRQAFAADSTLDDDSDSPESGNGVRLPALQVGQTLSVTEVGLDSRTTKAPKRFTEGSLITAMENIHQYVQNPNFKRMLKESAGIGTSATRSAIIDGLVERELMEVRKKDLHPSDAAMLLIDALPETMTAPDMTAIWQQLLGDVQARRSSHAKFMDKLKPWLSALVEDSADFFKPGQFKSLGADQVDAGVVTDFKCFGELVQPGCGSALKRIPGKFGSFFGCTNPACKKTFRDVGGTPQEKQPAAPAAEVDKTHPCPKCKPKSPGFLRRIERKDKSGYFWGCGNWKGGCKYICDDENGTPVESQPRAKPRGRRAA